MSETNKMPLKLHLGCGQRYLEGYLNIDFPLENHSVQTTSIADKLADITALKYPPATVAEVRLHHVYEHFRRPTAAALLASWNLWLVPGGRLHIEVPNLGRSVLTLINPFMSQHSKLVTERHLFGSHEASWAAHYEGYTLASLRRMVVDFGYRPVKVMRNSWRGTHNFELIAVKHENLGDAARCRSVARKYLESFLLDKTESELTLLDTWLAMFNHQLQKGI